MDKSFQCRDCGCTFETALLFSDHFERDETMRITGCKTTSLSEKLERQLPKGLTEA